MDRRAFLTYGAGAVGFAVAMQDSGAQEAPEGKSTLKISLASVMVPDQAKALAFYTDVLGFVKKQDTPAGGARWLTVVSADDQDGTELLLEPLGFPPATVFQKALYDAGIPWTAFQMDSVEKEVERLKAKGVVFKSGPTKMGATTLAVFDDTCGNLIQIYDVTS